jgi:hypothetical protein
MSVHEKERLSKGKAGLFFKVVPEKLTEAIHAVLDRFYELSPEDVESWFEKKRVEQKT